MGRIQVYACTPIYPCKMVSSFVLRGGPIPFIPCYSQTDYDSEDSGMVMDEVTIFLLVQLQGLGLSQETTDTAPLTIMQDLNTTSTP